MFCKWCGMESATTDQCSWCHRALSTGANSDATSADSARDALSAEEQAMPAPDSSLAEAALPVSAPLAADPSAAEPTEAIIAPWETAPPVPTPAPAVPSAPPASLSHGAAQTGARPVIGVRKPGSAGRGSMPAPGTPPRAAGSSGGSATTRPHMPAPPVPTAPMIGVSRAGTAQRAPAPTTAISPTARQTPPVTREAAPVTAQADNTVQHTSRPSIPANLRGGTAPMQAQTQGATAVADAPKEAEPVGLAGGVAAPPRPAAVPNEPEVGVPAMGTFTATKSKYYSGQVLDPISGTHYDADTGQVTSGKPAARPPQRAEDIVLKWDDVPTRTNTQLVARYTGVFAVLLAIAGLAAHAMPANYVIPLLAAQFLGAMLLPIMKVVPWADEDTDDVWVFVLLMLTVGPFAALIAYGVLSLVRQTANPAIVGCLSVAFLSRLVIDAAAGGFGFGQLFPFSQIREWHLLFVCWSGMVALVGWYAASMFHKLDE